MNPVSEKIDERILRLLGLTDVFDLDYDTYMTLLKEAMVSGARRLPPEELALIANERKRVRGKKGRLKPRPKKITADSVATTKFLKPSVQPISTPLIAPAGGVQAPEVQPVNLAPLQGPLESIKKVLSSFLDFRKDASEDERKNYEEKRRQKREEGLENIKKGMSAVSDAVKKFVSPFQGIIDRILRFILFTLLGRTFTQLIGWFSDPKNKRKVESLKRFIKDWWPSLLGAFVLFFTPFGKFVRGILQVVAGLTGKLIGAIPKIANAVKGLGRVLLNPWVAIPAAAIGLAAAANEVTGQRKAASVQAENAARAQSGQGLGVQGTDTMSDTAPSVGSMGPTTPYGMLQGAARGGPVMHGYYGIDQNTGERVSGFGPDTQLIAAMPGEVVINKPTVDAIGADTFLSLNRYYGGFGANQPRFGRFKTGGIVDKRGGKQSRFGRFKTGGIVGMQGGGNINKKFLTKRQTTRYPLSQSIQDAQMRLLNRAGQLNTNIGGWFNNLFPAKKETFGFQRPGSMPDTPIDRFKMPGFDSKGWSGSRDFRENSSPYKSNSTNPSIRYSPGRHHMSPGSNSPLTLRGGGLLRGQSVGGEFTPKKSIKIYVKGNIVGRRGGGSITPITNNYGTRIKGMGADTRFDSSSNVALQPGEEIFKYVLTKKSSEKGLGNILLSLANTFESAFNSTSNARINGGITKNPNITPLPGRQGGMITLPPIEMSSGGGKVGTISAGSRVPSFSAVSPSGAEVRSMNANIYGIVG